MTAGTIVLAEIAAKSDRTGEDLDREGDYAPRSKRVHQRARRSILSSLEMRFFLTNFLVTLGAYGLTSFVYPSEATALPRIILMWAAPIIGTMAALFVTRTSLLGRGLGAQALAIYAVSGIYCVVYDEKAILDTLQYVTVAYFLPGAILALLLGIFAKFFIK
jgi:hypothetical protein